MLCMHYHYFFNRLFDIHLNLNTGCLENGNVVVKGVSTGTNITIVSDQCKNKTHTSSGSSITIEAICLSSKVFTVSSNFIVISFSSI